MNERTAVDPVCGKEVDVLRARAVGIFGGVTFYFCSAECKARYVDPRKTERSSEASGTSRASSSEPPRRVVEAGGELHRDAAPPEAPPRRRWIVPMGFMVVLGIAGAVAWLRPGERTTGNGVASVATPPVPTMAPLDLAHAAVVDASVPAVAHARVELPPPLRLGLRRFVEHQDGRTTLTVWLLAIDATGHGSPFEVARLEVTGDGGDVAADAVQPHPEFTSATASAGTLFEDSVALGERHLDVRVVRRRSGVLVETRTYPGAADDTPYQARMELTLAEAATVRGAAFAKKRYLPDQPPLESPGPPGRPGEEH
jgi:YHS domain-containing protein